MDDENYWYTMPIAIQILDHIRDESVMEIIDGVIQLSETLTELHKKGVSHRDIKPSNIYYFENRFSLGDFGLVDFPENPHDFTRSDRGLGAIFTIAPEMKRNPKNSDGKKADVYSLAKTMWMFLSGDERGFDGEYNYLDQSHSLRYLDKYKDTHLVEIDELLKDATNHDPDIRPTMIEFKQRLENWVTIYRNPAKSQESEWKFLTKQLLGPNPAETSIWKNSDDIVNVLNIIGTIPAYNHLFFSGGGGLDFSHAKIATEDDCIKIYDTLKYCHLVKPKALHYERFGDNYKWDYFLLELERLEPKFTTDETIDSELLVEDRPGNYASGKYHQYGVYDYDSGELLPEGYKTVNRYINGKFLIVMKNSPYNQISNTYDGRHGMVANSDFRRYIEKLISRYAEYLKLAKEYKEFNSLSEAEQKATILRFDSFKDNPFAPHTESNRKTDEIDLLINRKQRFQEDLINNFQEWDFSSVLESDFKESASPNIKFYFEFIDPDRNYNSIFSRELNYYLCKDGYIRRGDSMINTDYYYTTDRENALTLKNKLNKYISNLLKQEGTATPDEYKNTISINFIKNGKPSDLFTKSEIESSMYIADDRVNNRLVVDEEGHVKVLENNQIRNGYLYPVALESWRAGNLYVGKYSDLNTLNDNYIMLLQGWLDYLQTGKHQYIDDFQINTDEESLISEIKKYY